MSPLPTDRTTANTPAEHVADHNALHAEYNTPTHTHSGTSASPDVLAETTLGSAATYIEFSGISSAYKHLKIEGRLRSDRATDDGIVFRCGNGTLDTGSNYNYVLVWPGITIDTNSNGSALVEIGRCPGANSNGGLWAWFTLDVQDYRTTTYWRVVKGASQYQHPSGTNGMASCLAHWKNTASAIDVIRIYPATGPNWIAGSQLRLIGIPAP